MNKEKIDKLLEHSVENVNSTVRFLTSLQKKEIVPISSGIDHLDKICLGGLLPDLCISVVSRSGSGKTYTINRIRKAIMQNQGDDIGVLLWNLEMPFFTLLLVELKKALKKPLKWIVSNLPTDDEKPLYRKVADEFRDKRLTKIDEAVTPDEFYEVTKAYIEKNKDKRQLFIMLDHIGIIKGKNKTESVGETVEHTNRLKLEYPGLLTFIILGQLNREIESRWKQEKTDPKSLSPLTSDVFSSDQLLFFSDVVMAQVIPQNVNMEQYVPVNKERYSYLNKHFIDGNNPTSEYVRLKGVNRIYYHYLKVRLQDGEPTIYCDILDTEAEEQIDIQSKYEKNIHEETINVDF